MRKLITFKNIVILLLIGWIISSLAFNHSPKPFASNVTRPINNTNYVISTGNNCFVVYTIEVSCTATIAGPSSGVVQLQISEDGGNTWLNAPQVFHSIAYTLAVTLQGVSTIRGNIWAFVPRNAVCRMVTTKTANATVSFISGIETLL